MQQLLFNPNTTVVTLSSPPTLVSQNIYSSVILQGVTQVVLNYNQLLSSFPYNPYKVILQWPGSQQTVVNNVQVQSYDNILSYPTFTFTSNLSAASSNLFTPNNVAPQYQQATVQVYYENGAVLNYYIGFTIYCDNIIDLDLNVLSVQNTYQQFGTVYNLQSNTQNTVYNFTDIIPLIPSITPTTSPTPSITPTTSVSPTPSLTPSTSIGASVSVTPSITPSVTPTLTPTPSITQTPFATPSITPTASITPSITPSTSITPSITPTVSVTPSITPSSTPSITPSITPSVTPSVSPTATPSVTPTASLGASASVTPSATPSPSPGCTNYIMLASLNGSGQYELIFNYTNCTTGNFVSYSNTSPQFFYTSICAINGTLVTGFGTAQNAGPCYPAPSSSATPSSSITPTPTPTPTASLGSSPTPTPSITPTPSPSPGCSSYIILPVYSSGAGQWFMDVSWTGCTSGGHSYKNNSTSYFTYGPICAVNGTVVVTQGTAQYESSCSSG